MKPIAKPYFTRAAHGGCSALQERTPELRPLAVHAIAVFGLGCLGAPSAMELARAGVRELRLLDHDFVDPATTSRWPLGLTATGLYKAKVLSEHIASNYPTVKIVPKVHRIGSVRYSPEDPSDTQILEEMTDGASLIYDATAEVGVNHLLSDYARNINVPYVGLSGTPGGWGGRVFRMIPGTDHGCWLCYRLRCADGEIPEPPSDDKGMVQPPGCADPTFTGAGFDMQEITLHGVRTAVSTMSSSSDDGYPSMEWDVTHVHLRNDEGRLIAPTYHTYQIAKHPSCYTCRAA